LDRVSDVSFSSDISFRDRVPTPPPLFFRRRRRDWVLRRRLPARTRSGRHGGTYSFRKGVAAGLCRLPPATGLSAAVVRARDRVVRAPPGTGRALAVLRDDSSCMTAARHRCLGLIVSLILGVSWTAGLCHRRSLLFGLPPQ